MDKESLTIVKIGGKIISENLLLQVFLDHFDKINGKKFLVHGGGRAATQVMNQLGIPIKMVNGRRITDKRTLEVVIMVYAGLVNKSIVAQLSNRGILAMGMSGVDGNCIQSIKRPPQEIDYGYVGDIISVNGHMLHVFLEQGIMPVICPITYDATGQLLNTNADTITNKVAEAMSQYYNVDLRFCFEHNGVLKDLNDPHSFIPELSKDVAEKGIKNEIFTNGMIPKLENAFSALSNGVDRLFICGIKHVHEDNPGTKIVL